jgi:hypothetical protein
LDATVAPALISRLGLRPALIAAGLFLPMLALVSWRRLVTIDAAARPNANPPCWAPCRSSRRFRRQAWMGSPPTFCSLASPTGTQLFQRGDPGDRFYINAADETDIAVDG